MIRGRVKVLLVCEKCGKEFKPFFSHDFQPQKCDVCGGNLKEQKREEVVQK